MSTLAEAARVYHEAGLPVANIYFVQAGDDGPIKIGVAKRPLERLATLQCGNPVPLHLRAVHRGYAFEERQLHEEYASSRLAGEWFEPTPDLLELVGALAELTVEDVT